MLSFNYNHGEWSNFESWRQEGESIGQEVEDGEEPCLCHDEGENINNNYFGEKSAFVLD